MALIDPTDTRPIHFVGIAGAGMSGLAELFVRRGAVVTGCDANPSGTDDPQRLGIHLTTQPPKHVGGGRPLGVPPAMPKDHPELALAHDLGVPLIGRPEAPGEAAAGHELVAIAGT